MPLSIVAGLFAGVGGLLPTLAKLAASFIVAPDQPLPHPHILFGLLLFFVIGFVLSFAFNKDSDIAHAVVIGIGAPGIITNILAGAANPIPKPLVTNEAGAISIVLLGISPAFAGQSQELSQVVGPDVAPNTPPPQTTKSVLLLPKTMGQLPIATPLQISVISNSGQFQTIGSVNALQQAQFMVPADSAKLVVRLGDESRTLDLWTNPTGPKGFAVILNVFAQPTAHGDLIWGIGGPRSAEVRSFDVQAYPVNIPP